jgi:mRNA interferase HigB
MRIIAKRVLMQKAQLYGDCITQTERWYRAASTASWRNLAEVRVVYPHADVVGDKTIFNLKGNDYRLIVYINYETQIIYIKDLLTHATYDRGGWQ